MYVCVSKDECGAHTSVVLLVCVRVYVYVVCVRSRAFAICMCLCVYDHVPGDVDFADVVVSFVYMTSRLMHVWSCSRCDLIYTCINHDSCTYAHDSKPIIMFPNVLSYFENI